MESGLGGRGFLFLPRAFGWPRDQPAFDGFGAHAHVAHFAINEHAHAMQIGKETPLGDGRHVRANTAALLRLTTAPDDTALDRALAG